MALKLCGQNMSSALLAASSVVRTSAAVRNAGAQDNSLCRPMQSQALTPYVGKNGWWPARLLRICLTRLGGRVADDLPLEQPMSERCFKP